MGQTDALRELTRTHASQKEHLADRMMARIVADIPNFAALDQATLAGVRHRVVVYVEGCLRAIEEQRAPEPSELSEFVESARARARDRRPLSVILHAYRLAVTVWWDLVRETVHDGVGDLDAVTVFGAGLMRYLDAVQSAVAEGYLDESERLAAGEDELHWQLIQSLLAGEQVHGANVELADAYTVIVLVDLRNRRAHPRIAHQLRSLRTSPGLLAAPRAHDVLALWPADASGDAHIYNELQHLNRPLAAAVAGGGAPPYAKAVEEAEHVLALTAQRGPGLRRLEDVPLEAMIRQVGGRVTDVVAGLLSHVERRQDDLLDTLRVFLDCNASTQRAAQRLHVHPNTVRYRLDRLQEVAGLDARQLRDAFLLYAALQLQRDETSRNRS